MSGIVLALAGATYNNVPAIGSALGGGYFAGQISTAGNGIADYNLVVGPLSSASTSSSFRNTNTGTDPTSLIDGPTNSTTMNDGLHPAVTFCKALTVGGFTDWYSPALNEIDVIYFNLKPTTASNQTSYGINANSVPKRTSNYTAGNPAQTTATDFQSGGTQAYANSYNWCSTGVNTQFAYQKGFSTGDNFGQYKTSGGNIRAIRRIPV